MHGAHHAVAPTQDRTRDEDPREAILRHADAAEKNPMWIAPAYQATQPVSIFNMAEEDEEDEPVAKKAKFDPNLRQKF